MIEIRNFALVAIYDLSWVLAEIRDCILSLGLCLILCFGDLLGLCESSVSSNLHPLKEEYRLLYKHGTIRYSKKCHPQLDVYDCC